MNGYDDSIDGAEALRSRKMRIHCDSPEMELTTNTSGSFFLLAENGDFLAQEDGFNILLESAP